MNGSNFVSGSVVVWNNSNRLTTFVSSTQLTAVIPATDISTGGTSQVSVFNPTPGGGTSAAVTFTITNFATSASPTSVTFTRGQSATSTITVSASPAPFSAAVALTCSLPSTVTGATCSLSPTSVTPGATSATSTLTITTTAPSSAALAGKIPVAGAAGLDTPSAAALGSVPVAGATGLGAFLVPLAAQPPQAPLAALWLGLPALALPALVLLAAGHTRRGKAGKAPFDTSTFAASTAAQHGERKSNRRCGPSSLARDGERKTNRERQSNHFAPLDSASFDFAQDKRGKQGRQGLALPGLFSWALLLAFLFLQLACGGGAPPRQPVPGTPPGTYTVTITGTCTTGGCPAAGLARTTSVTLVVQ